MTDDATQQADTYEFLKAQKDAILAKKEADENEWLKAAAEDIAHYKQERDLALAECERLRTRHWTILDDMNKSELDAYDLGCAESIAAVDKILDGKDDGSGTNNEPWYTQRKRLLSLTAECERLRADAERLDFVLANSAFIQITPSEGRTDTFQLLTQDEDENYIVMSGEDVWFPTHRAAIDAARGKARGSAFYRNTRQSNSAPTATNALLRLGSRCGRSALQPQWLNMKIPTIWS